MNAARPQNVILIGFMGTGKSTVGRALAARLGWTFVDGDHAIEVDTGMPIPQIFQEQGEPAFRAIESRVLKTLLASEQQVLATGGGAVLAEVNRSEMRQRGWIVALEASAETIVARVTKDPQRPLLQGDVRERVSTLLAQRAGKYDFADVKIVTDDLDVEQLVEQLIQALPFRPSI
jgi:shikimate kinase